jgi:hypothetical protein
MRLNEIITEQQLDERPMGILGKLGAKAQTLVPGRAGRRAKGKLEIGAVANEISDKFDVYLGKADTGEGATPELVLQFLKKNGYPTAGAETVMKEPTFAQKAGTALGKAASGAGEKLGKLATGAKNLAKDVVAGAKTGSQQAQTKTAPTTTPPPGGGGGAVQKIPSQTDDNISMSGVKANKSQPIKKVANSSFENDSNPIMEGFTGGQLDKIFMAAAKDYVQQQEGGVDANKGAQGSVSGDDAAQGGAGGFLSGFKQGMKDAGTGGDADQSGGTQRPGIPKDINAQLNQLNVEQKKELLGLLK